LRLQSKGNEIIYSKNFAQNFFKADDFMKMHGQENDNFYKMTKSFLGQFLGHAIIILIVNFLIHETQPTKTGDAALTTTNKLFQQNIF
jgi:hypothetical protein